MKRKVSKLRPSPNEEARLIREEHERRRKLRLQQVREQQRYIALQMRQEVEQRRKHELEQLEEELRQDWEQQQKEKLETLQRLYQENLQLLGQGHRSAKENEPDLMAKAQKEEENHTKAEERYREALKDLKSQRLKEQEMQTRAINSRKKALQAEKKRSAKVASLPPPPPNPIQYIDFKKPHLVKQSDVSAFASTHYHMPESAVDREMDTQQPDAHEEAELEVRRLQQLQKDEKGRREEQLEKAHLRGKQALRREHLTQDRERLLVELEHMQQTDMLRRRQQVSQVPPQVFQPLYKRHEMREDLQREMEFAFEDMYTGERRIKGDLVVQLLPEPLPALSTSSQDQELDVTMDEVSTPKTEKTQPEAEQEAESTENEISAHVESTKPKPAPRRALKKLLDRIRSQKRQWTDQSRHVPAADSSTVITKQVPERDTTIDTGSLTSEEKNKLPPPELLEPSHSATGLKTTEESTPADTQRPDVLAKRIECFEEQQKKEEDIEKQKLQQLVLLQELEEQKVKLEQLLLEAQQEREHLKAAVTQESLVTQPEVPQDQVTSVTSVLPTELVLPAGEDEHTRRIRQYQQQLLEQKRTHQRSVAVARQRLEEYQHALRIRYNTTSTSLLPAVTPPGLTQQSPHSTQSLHLPTPLQFPTTSAVSACIPVKLQTAVEVLTTEAEMQVSPLHRPGPSFSVGPKMLPTEMKSSSNSPRIQTPDVTAWLTDNIMERVTAHLPDSVRTSSSNAEPIPDKLFTTCHSTNIRLPPSSAPVQSISSNIMNGAQFVQGYADANPEMLQHSFLQMASLRSRDHDLEKQKQKLEISSLNSRRDDLERQSQRLQMGSREDGLESRRQALQEESLSSREDNMEWQTHKFERGSLSSREDELERQIRDRQEVQRWVLKQREAVVLQQRQQKEQRRRWKEQMRRQKEALQALIDTDTQPVLATAGEVLVLEDTKQTRLKLLASLLRAIEESNGGTLSHLEEPQEKHDFPEQSPSSHGQEDHIARSFAAGPSTASVLPSGVLPFHRAMKPPVTRVRLGTVEMTEQHELSMIQEVETPVNTSLAPVPEDSVAVASHVVDSRGVWDLHEKSAFSVASDRPQVSCGQPTNESPSHSAMTSNNLIWRKRLPTATGAIPEPPKSDSVLRVMSPLSSDSGRGADFSGPIVSNYRSYLEAHRAADSDCFSSTTISTGSYITTDAEHNADTSPPVRRCGEPRAGADLLDVSSPSSQSSGIKGSSGAGLPSVALHSVFNDSSIQQIIDRYMRELDMSLSAAGRTADYESSYLEEPNSSVSQQSSVRAPTDGSSRGHQSPLSGTAGPQRSSQECNITASPVPEPGGEEPSLAEGPEQDSFRPLIGQLADESSCVISDPRDSAMVRVVGHPSAQSSVIGQLPSLLPMSSHQAGWDSTLSWMIGQLSRQSSSHWLSGGQDFYTGQLISQMASEQWNTWLDEGQEDGQMRPLVGELDDDQHSGNSALPPEASSHNASVPGVNPQTEEQTRASPVDLGSERTEDFPGSDSFHPLLAEVTHNETADTSMTFHLPEHEEPNSPAEQPASGQNCVSTPVDESELSHECLRTQEERVCSTTLHESFSSLVISQCLYHESVLTVSPTLRTDVNLTAPTRLHLSMCDDTPAVSMPDLEEGEAERTCVSKKHRESVPSKELCAEEQTCEHGSNLGNEVPVSDKALDFASEKGILEQSITLESLTDTTLDDQETTATEEEESEKNKRSVGEREEEQVQQTEGSDFTEEMPGSKNHTHQVKFLEFHWGPSRDLQEEVYQQKRTVLLQKSSQRVEEIKARVVQDNAPTENQGSSAAREPSKPEASQPITSKAKIKSVTNPKTNMGPVELRQTTGKTGFIKQKKTQPSPPGSECRLKKVEVKVCTREKRKLGVSEMHQRTQKLYEQLEEVKHWKAIRSREEAHAKNRLKAKEFHKKTLQKLRAKQTKQ